MSTKVYNGIKFKSKDFNVVLQQLKNLREPAQKIAIKKLKERQIRVFIGMNDLVDVDPYEVIKKMEYSAGKTMRTHDDIDVNFHVSVFPHPNGNIYGYHFCDYKEYKQLLMVDEICEDYHYQNQTDMSNYNWDEEKWEDMTEERQNELDKDWEERYQIWEDLMGDGTFRENGFMYSVVDGMSDIWNFRLYDDIKNIQEKLKLQRDRKDKLNKIGS